MLYVAALNIAKRAAAVDTIISSKARKYIRRYAANTNSKKKIFNATSIPGGKFTIKCWIGETVRIPNK